MHLLYWCLIYYRTSYLVVSQLSFTWCCVLKERIVAYSFMCNNYFVLDTDILSKLLWHTMSCWHYKPCIDMITNLPLTYMSYIYIWPISVIRREGIYIYVYFYLFTWFKHDLSCAHIIKKQRGFFQVKINQ